MSRLFKNLFDLKGKVAVISGGSGGLGSAVATGFADYGAKVVIVGRRKEMLVKTADEINRKTGAEVAFVAADLTREIDVERMVKMTLDRHGCIDILANFVGTNIWRPAEDYPLKDWETLFNVNTTSVFLCCREVGKVMIKQRQGKIINVSSLRGQYAMPKDYLAYCASKAAVNMLTKQLACEWGKFNIMVNAIAPPIVQTPMTAHLFKDEKFVDNIKARTPLARLAQPDDLVGCAVFLASEASNFVTGQVILVDGGFSTS